MYSSSIICANTMYWMGHHPHTIHTAIEHKISCTYCLYKIGKVGIAMHIWYILYGGRDTRPWVNIMTQSTLSHKGCRYMDTWRVLQMDKRGWSESDKTQNVSLVDCCTTFPYTNESREIIMTLKSAQTYCLFLMYL